MTKQIHLFLFVVACAVVWTILLYHFGSGAITTERGKTFELVLKEAVTTFNKDQSFRFWATAHGGVYVPVSDRAQPNPYLSHLPDRDLWTTTGRRLTLMNPAYMMRQVMQEYDELYGTKGYITSLNPMNPINTPDDWQHKALETLAFSKRQEVFELVKSDGRTFLKLMRPMYAKEGCLKCHGVQGYAVGDLRGGVGVEVPMTPYLDLERQSIENIRNSHLTFWFFGMLALTGFSVWGTMRIKKETKAAEDIRLANRALKKALEEVKTLRGVIPICYHCKKIRNDKGAWDKLEAYICANSEAQFSHGLCPECYEKEMAQF